MEQRENLCCPVLTVTQLQSSLVRYLVYNTATIFVLFKDIPQLPANPMLTPGSTSIMVSWMQPPYSPSSYNVSYSCQLLCDTSTTQGSVTASSTTTNTISSLASGSSCMISVVAVYDGIGMSNTVTSFINTLTLGI